MYRTAVQAMIRRQVDQLNRGNYQPLLKMAAADAELVFPGDNSWSRQFRTPGRSRQPHATHRGVEELEAFARRFVEAGLRIDIDDILVKGPPWRTRICVRASDGTVDSSGADIYNNRVVVFIEASWGKIRRWEDYLDTERVSDWDRAVGADSPPTDAAGRRTS